MTGERRRSGMGEDKGVEWRALAVTYGGDGDTIGCERDELDRHQYNPQ